MQSYSDDIPVMPTALQYFERIEAKTGDAESWGTLTNASSSQNHTLPPALKPNTV